MKLTTVTTAVGEAPMIPIRGFGFQINRATLSALQRKLDLIEPKSDNRYEVRGEKLTR